VRTYPRAISGTPRGFFFNIKTGEFQLFFKTKKGVKGPTEIFIPKRHYPQGFNVQIYNQTAESQWEKKWDPQSQILYIKTEQSPTPYAITITRKK
jgi:endoglycosylceramidase